MPSSKTTVIAAKAYLLMDRTWATRGRPFIATSTGNVTRRSVSTGDRPGASTSTWTCTSVRSGKASTRSVRNAHSPPVTSNSTSTSTVARRLMAQATIQSIIAGS